MIENIRSVIILLQLLKKYIVIFLFMPFKYIRDIAFIEILNNIRLQVFAIIILT